MPVKRIEHIIEHWTVMFSSSKRLTRLFWYVQCCSHLIYHVQTSFIAVTQFTEHYWTKFEQQNNSIVFKDAQCCSIRLTALCEHLLNLRMPKDGLEWLGPCSVTKTRSISSILLNKVLNAFDYNNTGYYCTVRTIGQQILSSTQWNSQCVWLRFYTKKLVFFHYHRSWRFVQGQGIGYEIRFSW